MRILLSRRGQHITTGLTATKALRCLPWSIVIGGLLGLGIIGAQFVLQRTSPTLVVSRPILFSGIAAVTIVAALAGVSMRFAAIESWSSLAGARARGLGAFLTGANVGAVLLAIPVGLLVWRFQADTVGGWTYPFVNKRWLVCLYYIAIGAFLIVPVVVARMATVPEDQSVLPREVPTPHVRSWLRHAAALLSLVMIAWLFSGPPWNMDVHHRPIDFHEQVHLGPLQAIDKGYLPFVGPASTQYGPGSQLVTYWLMKLQGRFDVVAFRVAQAGMQFAAAVVVAVLAYVLCGWWRAVAVLLLAYGYSPLRFLYPLADGTMGGDYGWGNAWRYLGPIIVVPWLAHAITNPPRHLTLSAFAAGVVWGVLSWVAQENLPATFIAALIAAALLGTTNATWLRNVRIALPAMLAGAVLTWIVVIVIYAAYGAAGAYLENYFVVASAVSMGFQNSWWTGGADSRLAYYVTPLAIALAAGACLWTAETLRPRATFSRNQVTLIAMCAAALASYQTVLYRSDAAHLMNTMIALPFIVVLALTDLPFWKDVRVPARWAMQLTLAATALSIWPFGSTVIAHPIETLRTASVRFNRVAGEVAQPGAAPIAFMRATAKLSDEPHVSTGGPPMREFLEFANQLHADIGDRPVYVASTFIVYSSLYYFVADLRPAPFLGDPEIMIINSERRRQSIAHMQRHIADFQALATTNLGSDESRVFLESYPRARTIRRTLMQQDLFVLIADEAPRR